MRETMQAVAVLRDARELRLVTQDVPAVRRPADIKLRMLEVGVCGTDREISAFEYGTPPDGSDRLVIGFGGRFASAQEGSLAQWGERAGRFDVVYEAAGVSKVAFEATHQLAANGVFIFTGVPALRGPGEIDTD